MYDCHRISKFIKCFFGKFQFCKHNSESENWYAVGHHVCLLFTQYAPYKLAGGARSWDDAAKEEYANVVFDSIEKYAPGFK